MSFITSLGDWLRKVSKSFTSATISNNNIVLTRHNNDNVTLPTSDIYTIKSADFVDNQIIFERYSPTGVRNAYQIDNKHIGEDIDIGWYDYYTDTSQVPPHSFGAFLSLRSKNFGNSDIDRGSFILAASNEDDYCYLEGRANGTLQWGHNTVLTTNNISAGNNIAVTLDTVTGGLIISATDTVYTHPTTSGNKHIPSGGSSGQILRWSADGTAEWGADSNTTYTIGAPSGSGNAITALSISGDTITPTLGKTFSESDHTHSYLPLSGGTMTGTIYSNSAYLSARRTDAERLILLGGSSFSNNAGAKLELRGADYVNGGGLFSLRASDANGTCYLIGTPDGNLSWNGHYFAPLPLASNNIGQWLRVLTATTYSLPSGGTWAYMIIALNSSNAPYAMFVDIKAGGTTIVNNPNAAHLFGFVWRIA